MSDFRPALSCIAVEAAAGRERPTGTGMHEKAHRHQRGLNSREKQQTGSLPPRVTDLPLLCYTEETFPDSPVFLFPHADPAVCPCSGHPEPSAPCPTVSGRYGCRFQKVHLSERNHLCLQIHRYTPAFMKRHADGSIRIKNFSAIRSCAPALTPPRQDTLPGCFPGL